MAILLSETSVRDQTGHVQGKRQENTGLWICRIIEHFFFPRKEQFGAGRTNPRCVRPPGANRRVDTPVRLR